MGKLVTIQRRFPRTVSIIDGAPKELVGYRRSYGPEAKYETNRHIKYWSTWFLLKSLTASGFIQDWTKQQTYILGWLQMGVKTFRKHLEWLESEKLLYRDQRNPFSFRLVSNREACDVLCIEYKGTYQVAYNPKKIKKGKQPFQYLLRAEECETRKQEQVIGAMKRLENNPTLKHEILKRFAEGNADFERLLTEPEYFLKKLLIYQMNLFRAGSELLPEFLQIRADVNRGVRRIKKDHQMRSKQSVSYFKQKMVEYGFVMIGKHQVESLGRPRIYVPPNDETKPMKNGELPKAIPGYIWLAEKKVTAWRLTDQISRTYKIKPSASLQKTAAYAA